MELCRRCGSPLSLLSNSLAKCPQCVTYYRLDELRQEWVDDGLARELANRKVSAPIMEGRESLGPEIFSKPAQKDYFYRIIRFDGIDENGGEHCLAIHHCQNFEELTKDPDFETKLVLFCGKVRVGETLRQSLQREINQDLGIQKVLDYEVMLGEGFDYNRFYELLPQARIIVKVVYQPLPSNYWKGATVEWVDKNQLMELLSSSE